MKVVGLITEYNPFHNGHLYHVLESKKVTGADFVVVVMSGNFVQRGTPAIMDKYLRAKMALLNGADLVIELPVCYACASAEFFSLGAVSILNKINVVDFLCFGSELGDVNILKNIADVFVEEPALFKEFIKKFIKSGLSYPLARENALVKYLEEVNVMGLDINFAKEIISSPNNILGIEYLKALTKIKSNIQPFTINRKTANYHDLSLNEIISSATAIRKSLISNNELSNFEKNVPKNVFGIMRENFSKSFPIYEDDFSLMLKYKILLENNNLAKYMDVNKDLMNRILNNIDNFGTFNDFSDLLKTKQLTKTRIYRALIHILLDITRNEFDYFLGNGITPYARILGFRKSSSKLLRKIQDNSDIPIITKVGDAKNILNDASIKMFNKDILATNIYNSLVHDKYNTIIKNEFKHEIIIVD